MKRFYEMIDDSDLIANIFAVSFVLLTAITALGYKYQEWQEMRNANQIQLIFGTNHDQKSLSDRL